MTTRDDLHQQLFEFIYGLLSEKEAARMNERITSEPDVARAYAEVKQQADMLAKAAQLHGPPVQLSRPKASATPASTGGTALPVLQWLVGLAALALICVTGYYAFSPHSPVRDQSNQMVQREIASRHLRMVVTGPAQFSPGLPGAYSVSTTSVDRRPLSTSVEYALYAPDTGKLLMEDAATTGDDGRGTISLPPDKLVAGARLEIRADHRKSSVRMTTHVQVEKVRYATQLTTDKPLYRPGETVRFRSLTLTRFGLHCDRELPVAFRILDPAGGIVPGSQQAGYTDRGVASGQFAIGPHLSGGKYTLAVASTDAEPAFPEEQREFFIRKYRLPRLKKELELARDSYAPGDEVVADFLAERAEGGAAAAAQLHISATVDGQTVFSSSPKAGPGGAHQIEFTLPKEIEKGEGTLSVIVDDGGNRETIAKTIPINLGKVEVQFYPEGGDLVAGLENRVYFFGHDPLGEPVDIKTGRILDSQGREVARAATYHEGRGMFRFTPAADEQYRLEITEPADVQVKGDLPAVSKTLPIVINTGGGVFAAGQLVELDILAREADIPLVVTAVCRGTQVAQREFVTSAVHSVNEEDSAQSRVSLGLPPAVAGVVRLTVYDYSSTPPRPLAERLVYRRPARKLNIALADHSAEYSPGEKAQLSLIVTDERGRPRPAALGVSVVDDALLNLADDKSPRMPTFFYLASEIEKPEDLEDANFYLLEEKQKDKSPARALDLLLGTQGWRRFVQLQEPGNGATKSADLVEAEKNAHSNVAAEAATPDEERAAAVERLVALEGTEQLPTLFDNLPNIEDDYRADIAGYYADREEAIATAGRLSFFGGAVILVVLLLMAILRLGRGAAFWLPTSLAAAACLVVGGLWMGAEVDPEGKFALTGFAGFDTSGVVAMVDGSESLEEVDEAASELAGAFDGPNFNGPLPQEEGENEPRIVLFDEEDAADMPVPAGPQPAGEPPALEIPPAGRLVADADELLAEDDLRFAEAAQLEALGQVGKELRQKLGNFEAAYYLHGDRDGERAIAGEFWRTVTGEAISFDGTVHDVARMRTLWQRASKSGDERAALALGEAYQKLLQQYRLPVREYAHQHIQGEPGVRNDFTETLYWHPLLIADASGRASIEFELSDSVTTFIVRADAHGAGRIGTGGGKVVSRIPFSLEPKLPLEVNAGDRIDLPLAVNNDTQSNMPVHVTFSHTGELISLDGDKMRQLELDARQRHREYFSLDVVGQTGVAELKFQGLAGHLGDAIAKQLTVVPPGFPVAASYSGQIDGEEAVRVELPEGWVEGSLEVTLSVFPSSLADLQKGMEGMLRDPNGCFEQTSSSNYPNVLALSYMQEHDVADPNFTRRAKDLLKRGYDKLTSFECKDDGQRKGFEWFGQWPAHEALTAYGLLEFRDMAEVWDVDQEMIDRTAQWLMKRRDGKGGFQRNARALDTFGAAPPDITNAYIVWALTEAGQQGIEKELDHVLQLGDDSDDPYIIALAAASAMTAGREKTGKTLLAKLADHQEDDGHLDAKETSITRSGGISLRIETTALAALAWLKDPAMTAHANKAVQWITDNRQGSGSFGATQSTIMALKALIEHAQANRKTVAASDVVIRRDGEELARQSFAAGETGTIEVAGLAAQLTPGENELAIVLTGDNQMPYALDVRYRTHKPVSDEACPVRLSTNLSAQKVAAGETVQLGVGLENVSGEGQPMTVAIVGLPAGLEPRSEHLEELREAAEFDFYEQNAREIVFYWRGLSPDATGEEAIGFGVDLVAEIPGRYTGPASRAYLYYTAEKKHWSDPLAVEIARQ